MRERRAECVRQWDEARPARPRGKHVRREALREMRRLMDALIERLTQVRDPSATPHRPRAPAPRTSTLTARPSPAAQVELDSPTTCCSARARKRSGCGRGPTATSSHDEVRDRAARGARQPKKVLVKVAKMAVNAGASTAPSSPSTTLPSRSRPSSTLPSS